MHSHAQHHHPGPMWAMDRGGGRQGRGGPGGGRSGPGRWGFGPGGGAGFGRGGRGPRARRGDVRAALLVLLGEEPRNGYGLMQEIERRSEGAWRPSPGSVYPALQQLEDEGLVIAEANDGSRVFTLTETGRTYVTEHADELGKPWDAVRGDAREGLQEVRALMGQVAAAAWQVAQAGTEAQVAEARTILANTRKSLYRILAEDPPEQDETTEA
jgi:DNA-binding PadR family transcriptional regulator